MWNRITSQLISTKHFGVPSVPQVNLNSSLYCEVREKANKMQQLDVYYQYFLNTFRASLCPSSGEQDVCYCVWCAALVLLDVVGSGCGALHCRVRALVCSLSSQFAHDARSQKPKAPLYIFINTALVCMHAHTLSVARIVRSGRVFQQATYWRNITLLLQQQDLYL